MAFPETFVVQRDEDVSGISGDGIVAEGARFSDGWVVTHWLDKPPMNEPKTDVWHNKGVAPFRRIHGHGGKTRIVWADDAEARRGNILAAAVARAYALADRWKAAHGSSMFLVRAAGAELRDELEGPEAGGIRGLLEHVGIDTRGRDITVDGRVVDAVTGPAALRDMAAILREIDPAGFREAAECCESRAFAIEHGGVPVPAAECSAEYHGHAAGPRLCIRAAQHRGDHIDEHGFHWSDTVAVYPVADSQLPHQGPLSGIEVRDPCPRCEGCPLIPRHAMAEHVRDHHPEAAKEHQ
ncbi:hypothetical protein ABT124_03320 [Streptomyces sp. NPDC001982]|uniref:hypothetical protein n=1 Tax=Streptomyces sp. NPDC001982 TaxID=3154405 RepID=UPI00332D052B